MPNQSGNLYGLTILSPIIDDVGATPSHDIQIRKFLASLPTDCSSPFARAPYTHLCRLAVMDDVIYVGRPSCEEHLKFKYLVWEANFDCAAPGDADVGPTGGIDRYLRALLHTVPNEIEAIWRHCVGFPGVRDVGRFIDYMKSCQIETTFYFAAVNDRSLTQTLTALQTQRAVADFVATHRGLPAAALQQRFMDFARQLKAIPAPKPASVELDRDIKLGGRNE